MSACQRDVSWIRVAWSALLVTSAALVGAPAVRAECIAETVRLYGADTEEGDRCGSAVAIEGDTLVFGAYFVATPAGQNAGSVYVFMRSAGSWSQHQQLFASDAAPLDSFGEALALAGDTLLIGAGSDDNPNGLNAGGAYVFVRSAGVWTQHAKLIAPDGATGDLFAGDVALDGDTAVIGSGQDDLPGRADAGSAYVFVRSGTVWTFQAKLTASDGAINDTFGTSVALDGDTILVGADGADAPGGSLEGAAYVFTRSGAVWTQQARLSPADAAAGDRFGISVALHGSTAVIGAYQVDTPGGANAGAVYVFERDGTAWLERAKLTAADGAAGDELGRPVCIAADRILASAARDDAEPLPDDGAVYVFGRAGDAWVEQEKVTGTDAAGGGRFGWDTAAAGDTLVVGARLHDIGDVLDTGAVVLFAFSAGAPTILAQPVAQDVVQGGTAQFAVSAAGAEPFAYQWRRNGVSIVDGPEGASIGGGVVAGATSVMLSISGALPADAGDYDVLISNACGNIQSDGAALTLTCPGQRGDANCDGTTDFFDIDPFLTALFDPSTYLAIHCDGANCAVDVNCSGVVDFFDIDGFLACLFGVCPACQ